MTIIYGDSVCKLNVFHFFFARCFYSNWMYNNIIQLFYLINYIEVVCERNITLAVEENVDICSLKVFYLYLSVS